MAAISESEVLAFIDADEKPLEGVVLFQVSSEEYVVSDPTTHIMDQVDRQFLPNVLVVATGDLVSFPNSDSIRHHVYSFSTARSFDIELYGNSETPTLDFPRSGLVVVGCNIHDQMIGYIVVSEEGKAFRSDSEGQMILTSDTANEDAWFAWHPWMAAAGFAPVSLTTITRDEPMQFSIRAPEQKTESDLESRFRRRLNRGN
ncbi:hypothetical protein CWE13_03435 [Aliidiomarina shirensis]|uniref:Methylamine utilization protein n=1 Tax=Aliidiomarina shirensis TaxID=1048642 RepID=A0A432WY74_9GAMM|nr:methylamine utilization protein [Aliidiomarina shirensis]RUO38709.1 hypothetical protein CWE13_03435 [Aliidiomarina shirensis]